ncbi:MAG TPA: 2-amino-4-hydroxy-6-hydroxymethyldihydropteridine diphosphokinase [Magnetovibrio sp.]
MHRSSPQASGSILIGVGANLSSDRFGAPLAACEAALKVLAENPHVRVVARSRWFESEPVPVSDQPWFINGVVRVETDLSPQALLDLLHAVEARFGRVRTVPNAPRVLDLDLLAYGDAVLGESGEGGMQVPHPRLENRAFVLLPLGDVAPDWVHPQSGRTLADMVAKLPKDQVCRPLE